MNNPRFKRLISSLLLICFALWSAGCYSTSELTRLDPRAYPLEVVTKGKMRYSFDKQWSTDSLGVISGAAQSNDLPGPRPLFLREAVKIPGDSIASAYIEGNEIVIVTKDNSRLTFTRWMSDGSGGIFGDMRQPNPAYSMFSLENWRAPAYFVGSRRIPADSIVSIQQSEFNLGGTLLFVGGGVVVVTVVLAGLVIAAIAGGISGKSK